MVWVPDDAKIYYLDSFRDLITRPLKDLDKTAFHLHVTEIEKNAKEDFKDKDKWEAVRYIVGNYCRRTGVNYSLLLDHVLHKHWKENYLRLIDTGLI